MQSDFGWRIVGGVGAALVVWGGMLTPYVVAAPRPDVREENGPATTPS